MIDLNAPLRLSVSTSAVEFAEVQNFRQAWIQICLGSAFCMLFFAFCYQFIEQKTFGEHLFSFSSLALIGIVLAGLTLFVYQSRLEVRIDPKSIRYRLFPLQLAFRRIAWEEVDEAYIREYDALSEYGGWGARYGNRGNACTVSGRYGLQMELSDGRKILVGTHRPIELEKIILQLLYHYEMK